MKILIVDNNTQHIPKILRLLRDHECSVTPALSLGQVSPEEFDLIVLSGGRGRAVVRNRKYFKLERELIKNSKTPIIGICLGAEMIADVYGAKIKRMEVRRRLYTKISFVKDSPFDTRSETNWVFQMHKWAIRNMPVGFLVHATSKDGIEMFQHKNRQIFGLQFHPEVRYGSRDGAKIFKSVVDQILQSEPMQPLAPQVRYQENRQTA